jgi:hypothetical protein
MRWFYMNEAESVYNMMVVDEPKDALLLGSHIVSREIAKESLVTMSFNCSNLCPLRTGIDRKAKPMTSVIYVLPARASNNSS